jgi:hypothetical protein
MRTVVTEISSKKEPYGKIKYMVRDCIGNIKHEYEQNVDSYIQQSWDKWIRLIMTAGGNMTYITLQGLASGLTAPLAMRADGGINSHKGIIVGTSTNATLYANVNLGSRVAFGTSANQLSAGTNTIDFDFTTGVATISRIFTNNNNTTNVIVGECGLASGTGDTVASTMLAIKDTLNTTIELGYLDTLEIEYQIKFNTRTINFDLLFGRHMLARSNTNIGFFNQSGSLVQGSFTTTQYYPRIPAPQFVDNRGITVGSSNSAIVYNSHSLSSKIYNGSGSGQLEYGACYQETYTNTTSSNYFELSFYRYFINKTNSNITINEVGVESNVNIAGSDTNVMFDRAVIDPIVVEPNRLAKINWKIRYDF